MTPLKYKPYPLAEVADVHHHAQLFTAALGPRHKVSQTGFKHRHHPVKHLRLGIVRPLNALCIWHQHHRLMLSLLILNQKHVTRLNTTVFCHLMILMPKLRFNLYIFEVTDKFSSLSLTFASERKALKLCSVCWIRSLQSSTVSACRSRVSPSVSNQSLIYREIRFLNSKDQCTLGFNSLGSDFLCCCC